MFDKTLFNEQDTWMENVETHIYKERMAEKVICDDMIKVKDLHN